MIKVMSADVKKIMMLPHMFLQFDGDRAERQTKV